VPTDKVEARAVDNLNKQTSEGRDRPRFRSCIYCIDHDISRCFIARCTTRIPLVKFDAVGGGLDTFSSTMRSTSKIAESCESAHFSACRGLIRWVPFPPLVA
jgi:hypothetical protein